MPTLAKQSIRAWWRQQPFLKKLFWIYFFLWIFEGALRKWFLKPLSAPLLLVRDPIAIWIIWEGYRTHRWPREWSNTIALLTVLLVPMGIAQMSIGGTAWFVILYGWRSYLFAFPVAFIVGSVLDREDVLRIGKCMLWLLVPMVALTVAQYRAAPNAWLNAGAIQNGDSGQIVYIGNHVRAAGTFSYVAGPMTFIPLCAVFVFYGLADEKFSQRQKWLFWACAASVILAVPVVGSRTMTYYLLLVLVSVAVGGILGISSFGRTIRVIFPLLIAGALISYLPVFADATKSMNQRFSMANQTEGSVKGSLLTRVVAPVTDTVMSLSDQNDWLGLGMGYGSNVAAQLLHGKLVFMAAEDEFPRVLYEMGPIVGLLYMMFRYYLSLGFIVKGLDRARNLDMLPWLLVAPTVIILCTGILEQPTEQGYAVITMSLLIAAIRTGPQQKPAAARVFATTRPERNVLKLKRR